MRVLGMHTAYINFAGTPNNVTLRQTATSIKQLKE